MRVHPIAVAVVLHAASTSSRVSASLPDTNHNDDDAETNKKWSQAFGYVLDQASLSHMIDANDWREYVSSTGPFRARKLRADDVDGRDGEDDEDTAARVDAEHWRNFLSSASSGEQQQYTGNQQDEQQPTDQQQQPQPQLSDQQRRLWYSPGVPGTTNPNEPNVASGRTGGGAGATGGGSIIQTLDDFFATNGAPNNYGAKPYQPQVPNYGKPPPLKEPYQPGYKPRGDPNEKPPPPPGLNEPNVAGKKNLDEYFPKRQQPYKPAQPYQPGYKPRGDPYETPKPADDHLDWWGGGGGGNPGLNEPNVAGKKNLDDYFPNPPVRPTSQYTPGPKDPYDKEGMEWYWPNGNPGLDEENVANPGADRPPGYGPGYGGGGGYKPDPWAPEPWDDKYDDDKKDKSKKRKKKRDKKKDYNYDKDKKYLIDPYWPGEPEPLWEPNVAPGYGGGGGGGYHGYTPHKGKKDPKYPYGGGPGTFYGKPYNLHGGDATPTGPYYHPPVHTGTYVTCPYGGAMQVTKLGHPVCLNINEVLCKDDWKFGVIQTAKKVYPDWRMLEQKEDHEGRDLAKKEEEEKHHVESYVELRRSVPEDSKKTDLVFRHFEGATQLCISEHPYNIAILSVMFTKKNKQPTEPQPEPEVRRLALQEHEKIHCIWYLVCPDTGSPTRLPRLKIVAQTKDAEDLNGPDDLIVKFRKGANDDDTLYSIFADGSSETEHGCKWFEVCKEPPTPQPTVSPQPSSSPSVSLAPSAAPSSSPTGDPSESPSSSPTSEPSSAPSSLPSLQPSSFPSLNPSATPSIGPTVSSQPSDSPSSGPSLTPSAQPSVSLQPSTSPSMAPSVSSQPSSAPSTSSQPSSSPSMSPSLPEATERPSSSPSVEPSSAPSSSPSREPSSAPSSSPSSLPSSIPSSSPFASPVSAFNLTVIYSPTVTDGETIPFPDRYFPFFDDARRRWEEIITNDLPDIQNPGEQNLLPGLTADYTGTVDDVIVGAEIADLPGNTIGSAGPRFFRTTNPRSTVSGEMRFDRDFLDRQFNAGNTNFITLLILHEMGHALGVGIFECINNDDIEQCDDSEGSVNAFTCPDAVREFNIIKDAGEDAGSDYLIGDLRLENCVGENNCDRGNYCGHWEDGMFPDEENAPVPPGFVQSEELMTWQFVGGIKQPLTTLTIAFLDGLAYEVDYSKADPYPVPPDDDLNRADRQVLASEIDFSFSLMEEMPPPVAIDELSSSPSSSPTRSKGKGG